MGGLSGNVYVTLLLFAVSGIIMYGYLILAVMTESGMSWLRAGEIVLRYFLYFVPTALVLLFLQSISITFLWQLMVSIVAACVYYFYVLKSDPQIRALLIAWKNNLKPRA